MGHTAGCQADRGDPSPCHQSRCSEEGTTHLRMSLEGLHWEGGPPLPQEVALTDWAYSSLLVTVLQGQPHSHQHSQSSPGGHLAPGLWPTLPAPAAGGNVHSRGPNHRLTRHGHSGLSSAVPVGLWLVVPAVPLCGCAGGCTSSAAAASGPSGVF